MRFVTRGGYELEIHPVSKEDADAYTRASVPPAPPTRKSMAFGDILEDVPWPENPEYQIVYQDYLISLGKKRVDFLLSFVELVSKIPSNELLELEVIGYSASDFVWMVALSPDEIEHLIQEALYQATVTERGIQEAEESFGVTWMGAPLSRWRFRAMPMTQSREYEDRKAAKFSGISYTEFCSKSGREQSAMVVFMRHEGVLSWLSQQRPG